MTAIISGISTFFEKLISIFSTYSIISDTLDLLLLSFIIYYFIKLIRDTRALTFAKGLIIFALVYFVVLILDMQASAYLFSKIFESFLLIVIVIFAPEIRKVLETMGNTKTLSSLLAIFGRGGNQGEIAYNEKISVAVNEICRAVSNMSDKQIGALMIFEKGTPLGEIIATGTVLDATISSELVENVFYPKSPLHDGAAIVKGGKLYAAGCILPLTSKDLSSELGTRHRAAIGMSEQSDALVLVVSEETGAMSIAVNGTLKRNISDGEVRELLLEHLTIPVESKKEGKGMFSRKGGDKDGK